MYFMVQRADLIVVGVFSLPPMPHCYLCLQVNIVCVLKNCLLDKTKSWLPYACCGLLFDWFRCLSFYHCTPSQWNIKMALITDHLNAEIILVVTVCSVRFCLHLPHTPWDIGPCQYLFRDTSNVLNFKTSLTKCIQILWARLVWWLGVKWKMIVWFPSSAVLSLQKLWFMDSVLWLCL